MFNIIIATLNKSEKRGGIKLVFKSGLVSTIKDEKNVACQKFPGMEQMNERICKFIPINHYS